MRKNRHRQRSPLNMKHAQSRSPEKPAATAHEAHVIEDAEGDRSLWLRLQAWWWLSRGAPQGASPIRADLAAGRRLTQIHLSCKVDRPSRQRWSPAQRDIENQAVTLARAPPPAQVLARTRGSLTTVLTVGPGSTTLNQP